MPLTSYNSDNQISASGYVFDGGGNPTSYKGNTLTFDAENRMTSYGSVMTAGYTGDDLRAWKTTSSGTTYYLYDGTQVVCELDGSGAVTGNNTLGANGLISRRVGSTSTFYTFDAQGSCVQRFNSSGTILDTNICDAFGNRVSTDNSTDPYSGFGAKFGYYADSETGLELLTHRYYDPQLGRFINRDPSSSSGGLDLYAYTGNSPIDESDPDGLLPSYDDSGKTPCADQADMTTAIKEACAKIMDIHRVDNSSNPLCPTGKEKYCLRRLCAATFTIKCDNAYCASHPNAGADSIRFSGMTDPNNCQITMCTKEMNSSGFVYGDYGVDALANLIVHEMFHCCGRGDQGGPVVRLINPGPNDTDGVGVSNPADDGARCVMGLDGPYLKGYNDGN